MQLRKQKECIIIKKIKSSNKHKTAWDIIQELSGKQHLKLIYKS